MDQSLEKRWRWGPEKPTLTWPPGKLIKYTVELPMLRLHLPSFGLENSEPCSEVGKYVYQKGMRGVLSTSVHPL